jgi:hypothetical protein
MDAPVLRWKIVDDDGAEYDLVDYGPVKGAPHPVLMLRGGRWVWTGHRTPRGLRTASSKLPACALRRLLPLVRAGDPARAPKAGPHDDEAVLLAEIDAFAQGKAPGTLFSVTTLRATSSLPKERFDRAALALSREERVTLHHHDHPFGLSEAARAALVFAPTHGERGGPGIYYVGIAPRRARP